MKELGVTDRNNVVGDGSEKGIMDDYKYYEFMNVRIYPVYYRYFSSAERANKILSNGDSKIGWDGLIIPLGQTEMGDNNVELVQLHAPQMGTVSGLGTGNGEVISSSVHGGHTHYLINSGVISRINIYRVFMPWSN